MQSDFNKIFSSTSWGGGFQQNLVIRADNAVKTAVLD